MRQIRLLPILFALVPACGDDIKFDEVPDPAVNGVFPIKGFTDRTVRVEISGDGTEFGAVPTVDFGTGITVSGVEVASPSTLFATLTIAGDEALGKHDVTVKTATGDLVLKQAFEVENPLEVLTLGVAQAGFGQMLILNHDPEHPFFGDLEITAGTGNLILVQNQTEFTATAIVFSDQDATSGKVSLTETLVDSTTSRGGELTVMPRTPTPITNDGEGGFTGTGTLTAAAPTGAFSFTAPNDAVVLASTFFNDDNALFVWLINGKWANAAGFTSDDVRVMNTNDTLTLVVFNAAGGTFDLAPANVGYELDIDELFHDLTNKTTLAEVEPNDPIIDEVGTAQVITASPTLITAVQTDFFDFDVFEIGLTDGQSIHVTATTGSDGLADPEVIILDSALNQIEDVDNGFFEDVTTDPQVAGTYFVIQTCSFFADPVNQPYEMAVTKIDNAL